jgi:hypothetical protein
LAGGVPGQRVVVEGAKRIKYTPKPPGMYKNSKKNRRFPALFGLEISENAVFCSKVLNKIYS